jgi:hypothetical protein
MQAHPRQKIFLPPERSGRNHKTPERTTIEKPLYFCSRNFVGQFTCVLRVAVGSGAASERLCLFLYPPDTRRNKTCRNKKCRNKKCRNKMAQQESSSLEQYRTSRSSDQI